MEMCQNKFDPSPGLSRSLKVIRTDTYRSATYDFLLVFRGNCILSRSVLEIFAKKSHSRAFSHPLREFPLEFLLQLYGSEN